MECFLAMGAARVVHEPLVGQSFFQCGGANASVGLRFGRRAKGLHIHGKTCAPTAT